MTRPLRFQFAGALYHVTSRGDRRQFIYRDAYDRSNWLTLLGQTCDRYNFLVHSFCQMGNHYHLLVETVEANLAQGMRHLNGVYTQYFNRRHHLVGHLFQGRYNAIVVEKEDYLLAVARYTVLNPLRAKIVSSLDDWEWSSYPYLIGRKAAPTWMTIDWFLSLLDADKNAAISAYCQFLMAGRGLENPLKKTRHRVLLGNPSLRMPIEEFGPRYSLIEIARVQRRALALPLAVYQESYVDRDEAMARAYLSTAYTMLQIGQHFGVAYRTVSRAVHQFEQKSKAGAS
jgi:putative transposase